MPTDLLPPNATPFERALAQSLARISDVPVPLRDLWSPWNCPIELLPWLAWALSIDRWKAEWSEYQKRVETARAIERQRLKGTPASIEDLLESYDRLIQLVEWFETSPRMNPHTFQVIIPIDGTPAGRSTAAFQREIVRDIYRTKPARSHFDLVLKLATAAKLTLRGAGHATVFRRLTLASTVSLTDVLVTEDGFALTTETGEILEVG